MVYFVLTPRCFAYRHAATTFYQLQRGFWGRRQHVRIQEFLSVYLVLSLFYSLQRGFQWFYCWENYTYTLPRIQRGSIIFQGGVQLFPGGVQMLISIETHIRTCYFPEGGCTDPLSPSGSEHGQFHHKGAIFVTVPLLAIIVRGIDLSGLMTDEVFQMMLWYCARLTPSRNTALGSGSCNSAFFLQNIHYLNAVSLTISVTG